MVPEILVYELLEFVCFSFLICCMETDERKSKGTCEVKRRNQW